MIWCWREKPFARAVSKSATRNIVVKSGIFRIHPAIIPNASKTLIMISQIGRLVINKRLALIIVTPYIIVKKIVRYDILIPPAII